MWSQVNGEHAGAARRRRERRLRQFFRHERLSVAGREQPPRSPTGAEDGQGRESGALEENYEPRLLYPPLSTPRRQPRSVTWLPRGLSSWCRRWRVATISTAPPSGTSSGTRGGRKRKRRRRNRTTRRFGRTSTPFTLLPGTRRGRRRSGGRKRGRRSFLRPLPPLNVHNSSGVFMVVCRS